MCRIKCYEISDIREREKEPVRRFCLSTWINSGNLAVKVILSYHDKMRTTRELLYETDSEEITLMDDCGLLVHL
jgi:hypothetical protein